jgi:hypothetical protein
VASAPDSTGLGSGPNGQVIESSRSPSRSFAAGPVPPAENSTGSAAAAGVTVLPVTRRVVSTRASEPSG